MAASFADSDFSSGHELRQQGGNKAQRPGSSYAPGSEMPVLGKTAGAGMARGWQSSPHLAWFT